MHRTLRFARLAQRALLALLVLVLVGVSYRTLYIDLADQYKCGALLNEGQWLESLPSLPFQGWQPSGCTMHTYEKNEIETCLDEQRLVLIGDSTMRQIYWAIADKLGHGKDVERGRHSFETNITHDDLEFTSAGAIFQYIWDPWLNSTTLERELEAYVAHSVTGSASTDKPTASILVGAPGLWYARLGRKNYFKEYREAIDRVIASMNRANTTTKSSISHRQSSSNLLLLAPTQVPAYDSLSFDREMTITPAKIDAMNNYLQQTSASSGADVVWSYSLMTWNVENAHTDEGIHVVDSIAHRKADVLLNLRCNAVSKRYPYDGTCCMNYTQPGGAQLLLIVSAPFSLLILFGMQFLHARPYTPKVGHLITLGAFLLVLFFSYLADRTQLFEKAHKDFRSREFFISLVFLSASGLSEALLSFTKIASSADNSRYALDSGFLARHQIDEWKGWMQAAILISHYTGASESLPIYQAMRVFVASYLFMTGYDYTFNFLQKRDYSLNRVVAVLIRMNLLSLALSYMMRTDYIFYHFPALFSFWFLVIHFVLRFGNKQNYKPTFVLVKIILSTLLTRLLTASPRIWEFASFLLRITCRISWNTAEWALRLSLDHYIVYVGMVTALFHHRCHHLEQTGHAWEDYVDLMCLYTMRLYHLYTATFLLLTAICFCGFWIVAAQFTSKESYNQWQPLISILPILCFVLLRNSSRQLRGYHSTIFAWLGRISLETFVLQYHIWLAGDTKVLLRLGLFNRGVEAGILTVLFIWLSWCTSRYTHDLTNWFVGVYKGGRSPLLVDDELTFRMSETSSQFSRDLRQDVLRTRRYHAFIASSHWFSACVKVLEQNLRWRLVALGVVLWLANVTYW